MSYTQPGGETTKSGEAQFDVFSDAFHRNIWQPRQCVCDDSDVCLAANCRLLPFEICPEDYRVFLSRIRGVVEEAYLRGENLPKESFPDIEPDRRGVKP